MEVEASGKPAPAVSIKPATSAFGYYQKETNAAVRAELAKEGVSDIGSVQKAISARWQSLSPEIAARYHEMAAADRSRYDEECAARDREVEEAQERKRAERDAEVTGPRVRTQLVPEKEKKARMKKELSAEQLARQHAKKEERDKEKAAKNATEAVIEGQRNDIKTAIAKQAEARLQYLLKQSDVFSHFGVGKENAERKAMKAREAAAKTAKAGGGGKHRHVEGAGDGDEEGGGEGEEAEEEDENQPTFLTKQPSIITNGQLRHYQLEGLNWMIRLNHHGINGILADEMGLGKTLQSISVLAYMAEFTGISGPHLILVPKSTLSNWILEIERWCPTLRAMRFHGNKEERARLVKEELRPGTRDEERAWDVLVTTYEVANMEKNALQKIAWRYLVIDEAHRLKNEASRFSQTVRTLHMQHRLLLTGTPLQNNLHELWALLNFLLPDVFSSSEQFDSWFNLEIDDDAAKERMIKQLHKILKPFMLRRLKADVEKSLPPKTETILFIGMSAKQKEVYRNVLLRDIDMVNGTGQSGQAGRTAILNIMMQLRKCCNHPYLFAGVEDRTLDPLGEHLIETCGKMVLLDRLLEKLYRRGSRVLLFSQMTRMLDIFEDFCQIRSYEYCRIDGNTSYEDREDQIADYNAENSSKFLFMLSTRAGGLGINLQTADVVILYDSDWNPQADLQAMDRAHRIGQKKPVSVFRLVTENTVEEKVVERAQQKLKLDAMVVQSGRLQDKEKKMAKEDLLAAMRFGADTVFRSKDTSITDEDIDAILARGEARTKEMDAKLEKAEKGDMLDFRLDGDIKVQEYEGVDYSDKSNRAGGASVIPFQFIDTGRRERKKVASYKEDAFYTNPSTGCVNTGKKRNYLPKQLRLPRMDEWHFYEKKRLLELQTEVEQKFEQMKAAGELPPAGAPIQVLDPEKWQERTRLLGEGFGTWTKQQYQQFVRASAKHGRDKIEKIAAEVGKEEDEVRRYANTFWSKGETSFSSAGEWEKHVKNIERGERKIEEISRLMHATKEFVARFQNPWEQLAFQFSSTHGKVFNVYEDRYLLCLAHEYGYGAWDKVKAAIRRSDCFRCDYFLRSCSSDALGKRCEALMKAAEKENAEWRKRQFSVHATPAERKAPLHDKCTDENTERKSHKSKQVEFDLKQNGEAQKLVNIRNEKQKLRESQLAEEAAASAAAEAAAAEARGSSSGDGSKHNTSDATQAGASPGGKASAGGGKTTAKGTVKAVPAHLIPELTRLVARSGSKGLDRLVTEFVSSHTDISKRQVELRVQEIGFKEKRQGDTRESWYIRPAFQKHLEGEEKEAAPAGNQAAAATATASQPTETAPVSPGKKSPAATPSKGDASSALPSAPPSATRIPKKKREGGSVSAGPSKKRRREGKEEGDIKFKS
ncbi:unnamed protein product [Chrysoparadoxa australica]